MCPVGGYINHISKISSSELNKMFHVDPDETIRKIDEKLTFDLISALFKKGPKYGPRAILCT